MSLLDDWEGLEQASASTSTDDKREDTIPHDPESYLVDLEGSEEELCPLAPGESALRDLRTEYQTENQLENGNNTSLLSELNDNLDLASAIHEFSLDFDASIFDPPKKSAMSQPHALDDARSEVSKQEIQSELSASFYSADEELVNIEPDTEGKELGKESEGTQGGLGGDRENDRQTIMQKVSKRKKAQEAAFSEWLSNRKEAATQEEMDELLQNANPEKLAMHALLARENTTAIITDPREYQIELYERAKKENVIAVLATGSGKTLIAVLLLRHVLEQELEHRARGGQKRVAFFLVGGVALVFQQAAVLECNLSAPIDKFCGDMNTDAFGLETWNRHFDKNQAIVCTAEILYQCLSNGFITMERINLLIFDEAHHTKKNHVYARIIRDFYNTTSEDCRPKLFGMTASPCDTKVDVTKAAYDLEELLNCRICTASDLSLLQSSVSQPHEEIQCYEQLIAPYKTNFCNEIVNKYGGSLPLSKIADRAKLMAAELGEYAADALWALALQEEEAAKLKYQTEKLVRENNQDDRILQIDREISMIQDARDFVKEHYSAEITRELPSVSSKVIKLLDILHKMFDQESDKRCIIFVTRRQTARLLADILRELGHPLLRVGVLVGQRIGVVGEAQNSVRDQILTISKFRRGELNCLLSTSVGEEGLDIPGCNTVICFDMYRTVIEYIQRRGRARQANSTFINMIQENNLEHASSVREAKDGENLMRDFCESLPEDRLLQGNNIPLRDPVFTPRYVEPGTNATLTFGSVLTRLQYFCDTLPRSGEGASKALYDFKSHEKGFICEVTFPPRAPIETYKGFPYRSRCLAKQSAAFEALLDLRNKGLLDENLLPTHHKQVHAMRNAHLALNAKSCSEYNRILKPKMWERGLGTEPTELFLTHITLDDPSTVPYQIRPLILLTRERLPLLPKFPLHVTPESSTLLRSTPSTSSLLIQNDDPRNTISLLNGFTLSVMLDIFNKEFKEDTKNFSYWLAPASSASSRPQDVPNLSAEDLIDWQVLTQVKANPDIRWKLGMLEQDFIGRFIVDPWDGGRRFFSEEIETSLNPNSELPKGCATHKYQKNILDYSCSLFEKARAKATWVESQPVFRARKALHRLNWLDEWSRQEKDASTLAYLCPEPLRISAIPTDIVSMCYFFPSIIFRFEAYIVALDACELVGLSIKPDLALEALTQDSNETEESKAEQALVAKGMGKNYERLEFIGDTFLKMSTSISLFVKYGTDTEHESHVKRVLMVCNKNLLEGALDIGLQEYVRTQGFSRRTWYPEGLQLLRGKGAGTKKSDLNRHFRRHSLKDKAIADVCEALIGAALLSWGNDWDMAVRAVSAMVKNDDHDEQFWAEFSARYEPPEWQLERPSAAQIEEAKQVVAIDGYEFKWKRLLSSAFTHPSCPYFWAEVPNYQRLEFLGDSLLDMVCVNWLFAQNQDKDPQWLTEHKMAMVSNQFLGAFCVHLGFHRFMKQHNGSLTHQIKEYVCELELAREEANGAVDYWLSVETVPPKVRVMDDVTNLTVLTGSKCLADIVEAYIGALFIDSGFIFAQVERFFNDHILGFFEDMSVYDSYTASSPITQLSILLSQTLGCSHFRFMCDELPSADGHIDGDKMVAAVMIHNKVVADDSGTSARYAKGRACQKALNVVKELGKLEFIERFGCNCVDQGGEDDLGEDDDEESVDSEEPEEGIEQTES